MPVSTDENISGHAPHSVAAPAKTVLAFDTETRGFNWFAGETAFIATTADAEATWCYNMAEPADVHEFTLQLCRADILVAHNLKFDTHQVRETIGLDLIDRSNAGKVELHDTDLMSRVFWPQGSWDEHGGFGLDALTTAFLGREGKAGAEAMAEAMKSIGIKKSDEQAYFDTWRAFPEVVEKYARLDARDTWDLFALLQTEADKATEGLRFIYELEREVLPLLLRAEQRGTALDKAAVYRLHKTYKQQQRDLHDELSKRWGDEALGGEGSEGALERALLSEGVPLTERTESGKLSTSQYHLGKFEHAHPVVARYLEYRHVEKFLATYIEPLVGEDVVHTSFQPIGTWTGRMSCRRPNMQNIPVRAGNEVREVFVAREGYKLLASDYDSIEVRLLAYYLGTEGAPYRDLINAGLDPHAWMAAVLASRGVHPFAEVVPEGDTWTMDDFSKDSPNAALRAQAKNKAMFPVLYGAGGYKLAVLNGLPTEPLTADAWEVQRGYKQAGEMTSAAGKALARQVKAAIPGYAKLNQRVKAKVEAHGYVTTIMGRKQAIDREKSYVGLNALIQGSAADVMKAGLLQAADTLHTYDGHVLLVVHDEIVAEVPEHWADMALDALQDAMQSAFTLDPPLLTSGVIVDNYGAAK